MKKKEPNHQHQGIQLKDQTINNQTNISKESNQPCKSNLVTFLL
jgi:hypothetical protein